MDGLSHSVYAGFEINVMLDGSWLAMDGEHRITADTLGKLHEKIDRVGKVKKVQRRLNLAVIDQTGKSCVVTGVNLHTRAFTGTLTTERYGTTRVYVDTTKVRDLIIRIRTAEKALLEMSGELSKAQLLEKHNRHSGDELTAENYSSEMDALEKQYAEKVAANR